MNPRQNILKTSRRSTVFPLFLCSLRPFAAINVSVFIFAALREIFSSLLGLLRGRIDEHVRQGGLVNVLHSLVCGIKKPVPGGAEVAFG